MEDALFAYYQSDPAFAAEYTRNQAASGGRDRRTPAQWLSDGLQSNPQQFSDFQSFTKTGRRGGQEAAPAAGDQPEEPPTISAEEALFRTILDQYITPDINRDAQRRTDAQSIVDRINSSLDHAQQVNSESADRLPQEYAQADTTAAALRASAEEASRTRLAATEEAARTRLAAIDARKAELTTALDTMQGDRTGALDGQTAQLRAALAALETERSTALQGLEAARLSAAQTQVSGVNQALESTKDKLAAEDAAKGFLGGSTAQQGALVRAVAGARQQAAETVGAAKVANATDRRGLGDDIANQRFGIEGADATQRRGILDDIAHSRFDLAGSTADARVGAENLRAADTQGSKYQLATDNQAGTDKGTQLKQTYFDNDFGRRLQAALQGAAIDTQRLTNLSTADTFGSSGINRSLQLLNWFGGQNTPPTSNPYTVTPSTAGADLSALGAGVVGSALNVANANNWWQTPKTVTPAAVKQPATPQLAAGATGGRDLYSLSNF